MVRTRSAVQFRPWAYFLFFMDALTRKLEIKKASEVVKEGGLIVLPTDTVMGLGTHFLNLKGQKKIYSIKKRKLTKPLVIFIKDRDELKNFVLPSMLGILRKKIISEFWPGALTLVFKSKLSGNFLWISKDKKVGVRMPDYPLLFELLDNTGPLATTSANISGKSPVTGYKRIDFFIKKEVDYIIPENSYGLPPSTVLDVSTYPFKLLRKGPVSIVAIEETVLKKIKLDRSISLNILFVCTGNTCRSPMAMGLMRKYLPSDLRKIVRIKSRGINPVPGGRISRNARKLLKEYGIDLSFHKARPIDIESLDWADFIFVMERDHFARLSSLGFGEKVRLLSGYSSEKMDIYDPYGKDIKEYKKVLKMMKNPIRKIVKDIIWRYEV